MTVKNLALARAATLVGSVLTTLSSGTNYGYSAYAPQLGSRLHMTHTQLNIIGLSGNMGVYTTGPLVGRLVDTRGPRPLLLASIVLLFTGYIGLRLYYDAGTPNGETLSVTSLIAMSIFLYMTGAGGSAGLQASVNTTAKSFPERMRATTMGFVISGFGLSAFLFSTLGNLLFPGNTSSFLLFLALGTSLPVVIGYLTIRPVPHAELPDAGPGGLTPLTGLARSGSSAHLLDQGDMNGVPEDEIGWDADAQAAGVTAVHPELISAVNVSRAQHASFELSPTQGNAVSRRAFSRRSMNRTKRPFLGDPINIRGKRMLLGWEFWLLTTILSLLSGTGIMFMNNVGSITQALAAKGNPNFDRVEAAKIQGAQVSIISLANCAGRILFGVGADLAKNHYPVHRSYLLSLVSIMFIISQIVASHVENVAHLWQASVILGIGYGGVFGLLPPITIEWFGLSHFSENWGFVSLAPLFGGNVFSILFGRNLDAHVPKAMEPESPVAFLSRSGTHVRASLPAETEHQCLEGRECYAGAMSVTTYACVVALGLCLLAAWRDWRRHNAADGYESVAQEVIWEERDEAPS